LSFDGVNGSLLSIASDAGSYRVRYGFFSNFSAALACISNVGPAFEAVGPYASFAVYNDFSTVVLTFAMILGRLEIFPVLILFHRRTWAKVSASFDKMTSHSALAIKQMHRGTFFYRPAFPGGEGLVSILSSFSKNKNTTNHLIWSVIFFSAVTN